MTYDQEPTRWTASPEEAPELLRGAFMAGRHEGPNKAQVQALALKIAALSAGSAVAVGTAKAAAGSQMAASAASWSLGKLAGVLILAGGVATGAVIWNRSPQPTPGAVTRPAAQVLLLPLEQAAPQADAVGQLQKPAEPAQQPTLPQPVVTSLPSAPGEIAVSALPAPAVRSAAVAIPATSGSAVARRSGSSRSGSSKAVRARAAKPVSAAPAPAPEKSDAATSPDDHSATPSEIELLRRAQLALRARPREAYQLTEQHRQLYPNGEFALERDALAIQALISAGNPAMARDLAESFLRAHPDSPHAHRFREAMGIH